MLGTEAVGEDRPRRIGHVGGPPAAPSGPAGEAANARARFGSVRRSSSTARSSVVGYDTQFCAGKLATRTRTRREAMQ